MLPLTKSKTEDLKVFFFVARPAGYLSTVEEQGSAVLAFNLEDAFKSAHQQFTGRSVTMTSLGEISVTSILNQTEKENAPQKLTEPTKVISKEQFIQRLQLCLDEFVTDEKDKTELGAILERAK